MVQYEVMMMIDIPENETIVNIRNILESIPAIQVNMINFSRSISGNRYVGPAFSTYTNFATNSTPIANNSGNTYEWNTDPNE